MIIFITKGFLSFLPKKTYLLFTVQLLKMYLPNRTKPKRYFLDRCPMLALSKVQVIFAKFEDS